MIIELIAVAAVGFAIYKHIGAAKITADVKAAVAKVEALVAPAAPATATAPATTAPAVTALGIVATIKADLKKYL